MSKSTYNRSEQRFLKGLPCGGCEERHEACHDTCERYQAWKKDKDSYRKAEYEEAGRRADIIMSVMRTNRQLERKRKK